MLDNAIREDSLGGMFIGYPVDREILECSQCTQDAAYRLRYTKDQTGNLAAHRFRTLRLIADEHPNHRDDIHIA
jgi:hypothetical protein